MNGGTGLYAGEQDLFAFLIDPFGMGGDRRGGIRARLVRMEFRSWAPVARHPDILVPGRLPEPHRLGCHRRVRVLDEATSKIQDGLSTIRSMIDAIVRKRDERKDGFAAVVQKAMEARLGADAEEAFKNVSRNGIPRSMAQEAIQIAQEKGRLTVWSVVDALTRLTQKSQYAGDRTEADAEGRFPAIPRSVRRRIVASTTRTQPRQPQAAQPAAPRRSPSNPRPLPQSRRPTRSRPCTPGRTRPVPGASRSPCGKDRLDRQRRQGGLPRHLPAVVPQAGRGLREHRHVLAHGPSCPGPWTRSRLRSHQRDAGRRTVLTTIERAARAFPTRKGPVFQRGNTLGSPLPNPL